jgi:hypothetical protein
VRPGVATLLILELLVGDVVWAESHREFHDEASPRTSTFVLNTIVDTHSEVVLYAEVISPGSEGLI